MNGNFKGNASWKTTASLLCFCSFFLYSFWCILMSHVPHKHLINGVSAVVTVSIKIKRRDNFLYYLCKLKLFVSNWNKCKTFCTPLTHLPWNRGSMRIGFTPFFVSIHSINESQTQDFFANTSRQSSVISHHRESEILQLQ